MINVFSTVYSGEIRPSDELDGGRFWTVDEIAAAIGKGVMTPNFEQEFLKLKEFLV